MARRPALGWVGRVVRACRLRVTTGGGSQGGASACTRWVGRVVRACRLELLLAGVARVARRPALGWVGRVVRACRLGVTTSGGSQGGASACTRVGGTGGEGM